MPRGFHRMRLNCCSDSKFFSSLPPLSPIPLPSSRETHLWYVIPNEVKGESLMNKYMEILSPCEKEHVLSMQGEELRTSALLARTLVRTTIARYQINSSISPKSLKFRKSIHGKPEVDWQQCDHCGAPPLHFNISHTSSVVACGVTVNSPIGVDVEAKKRTVKHNVLNLARRYFSEHELEVLSAVKDPHLQHQEFMKLWTLKEAYVKALGRGFSASPFNTFTILFGSAIGVTSHNNNISSVIPQASEISVDDPSDQTGNWQFMLLELAGSHYAAICTEKDVINEGNRKAPMKLTVWKTIPFVEDKCVSGTETVHILCGSR
ncbi:uncharacterized protein LOC132607190 isoform X1 [Lycium barbarum]|uniref:uncharacterized protein LOC132607190 isoform X1 n=1 Tax=Lycium barbarum TaxID=112863 RepID=UPI00293F2300|nr:uncharacterized protein LOC132607190 isoform X1 [Lycium barbarum]